MKPWIIIALCLAPILHAGELETLGQVLQTHEEQIAAELAKAGKGGLARYLGDLDAFEKQALERGTLDGVLLIQQERKRLKDRIELPRDVPKGLPPSVAGKLKTRLAEQAKARQPWLQRRQQAYDAFAGKLKTLEQRLVKQGNINGALAVRDELKRIKDGPANLPLPKLAAPAVAAPERPREVLRLSFDRDDGSAVRDGGPNKIGVRTRGGTWTEKGLRGGAITMGKDAVIDVSAHPDFDFTASWTITMWINPERKIAEHDKPQWLFSRQDWGEKKGVALGFNRPFSTDLFVRSFRDGTFVDAKADASIFKPGVWVHVAGVQDKEGLKLYLDGKEAARLASPEPSEATTNPIYIGGDFAGRIDEVMVFGEALSEAQVRGMAVR